MADEPIPPLPPVERPRSVWPLLFRGAAAATDPRCLILAGLGLVALRLGWGGIGRLFGDEPWAGQPWSGRGPIVEPALPVAMIEGRDPFLTRATLPLVELIRPFDVLFRRDVPVLGRVHAALAGLWALAVWCLFGGAIARVAVVRVATSGRVGVLSALRFCLARFGSLIAAPLAPLLVAWLIGLAGAWVGLLARVVPAASTALAFVPLIVGLLDAVILIGLVAAWPLMVATVVADGEDFFDAVSRSYSYVNQRTFRYLGYVALAAAIGVVGAVLFGLFMAVAIGLADWCISLGAVPGVGFRFAEPASVGSSGLPGLARFWNGTVSTIVAGWTYSYLWSAAAILYLVLRYEVDGAEVHDIYEPSHEADAFIPDDPPEPASPTEAASAKPD